MNGIRRHFLLGTTAITAITLIFLSCAPIEDESDMNMNCVEGLDVKEFYFYGFRVGTYNGYMSGDIAIQSNIVSTITLNDDRTFVFSIVIQCDSINTVPICYEDSLVAGKYEIQIKGSWNFTQKVTESMYGSPFDGYFSKKDFNGNVFLNVTESSIVSQIASVIEMDFNISCFKGLRRTYNLFVDIPLKDSEHVFIQFLQTGPL